MKLERYIILELTFEDVLIITDCTNNHLSDKQLLSVLDMEGYILFHLGMKME